MKCCIYLLATFAIVGDISISMGQDVATSAGIYDHKLTSIDGQSVELSKYKGKVLLIVNVASECGMTPQYAGLQSLHEKYKDQGLAILGIPCNQFGGQEPGSEKDIKEFCSSNYRVAFDMFSKVSVKGNDATPLYKQLTAVDSKTVKPGPVGWNFEKFLVSRQGRVIARFDSGTEPDSSEMLDAISKALADSRGDEFRILAWNVESNRPNQPPVSDAQTIGSQLKDFCQSSATRSSIVALSEVEPRNFETFRASVADGLGSDVDYVTSASGGFMDSDSLMLIADRKRFEIQDSIELHRYAGIVANFNIGDAKDPEFGALRARSPLAVKILDKTSGKHFWVIVNHLARGEVHLRTDQAKMLRKWAEDHTEPIVAVGDFNFDYDFKTMDGNDGFKAMLVDDVWSWLKPEPLIDSNWSDDRRVSDRRVDRYPDSILDFAFVANAAKHWKGESEVVVREGDFPDDEKTSDHRPIIVKLSPP